MSRVAALIASALFTASFAAKEETCNVELGECDDADVSLAQLRLQKTRTTPKATEDPTETKESRWLKLFEASRPGVGCAAKAPPDSALVVIDMQYDFIDGDLPVEGGASIVPTINKLVALEGWKFVGYTMDYHPQNHASFAANSPGNEPEFSSVTWKYTNDSQLCGEAYAEMYGGSAKANCSEDEVAHEVQQTLWPVHCVQGTRGQHLHKDLLVPDSAAYVRKGYTSVVESYGAFENNLGQVESNLKALIAGTGAKHVYMVGLALDFCVKNTALQSVKHFTSTVILDATKPVSEEGGEEAVKEFNDAGITTADAADVNACY